MGRANFHRKQKGIEIQIETSSGLPKLTDTWFSKVQFKTPNTNTNQKN